MPNSLNYSHLKKCFFMFYFSFHFHLAPGASPRDTPLSPTYYLLSWATLGKPHVCEGFMVNAEEMAAKAHKGAPEGSPLPREGAGCQVPCERHHLVERPSKLNQHGQATYYVPAEVWNNTARIYMPSRSGTACPETRITPR